MIPAAGALAGVVLAQGTDPTTIRRTVQEVLSRPEYADVDAGRSFLERALDVVLEGIGRLLLQLDRDGGRGSVLGAIGLLLVVLGLLGLVLALLRRFRRTPVLEGVVPGPPGRDPRNWAAEAAAHEAAGDHRQALRCRYRETVALLARRGVVDEVPGRTTGEYLARVADALPAARDPFGVLTSAFERAWYGDRPVDDEAMRRALTGRAETLRAAGVRDRAEDRPRLEVPS